MKAAATKTKGKSKTATGSTPAKKTSTAKSPKVALAKSAGKKAATATEKPSAKAAKAASKPSQPKKSAVTKPISTFSSASKLIDKRIKELTDWRGKMLGEIRAIVKEADPEITEEWKWRGVPVWSRNGIVCTGETYKSVVKMTFAKGAALSDPAGLFNSSLEGNTRRAIDFHEGTKIDGAALKALIHAAIALNQSK